MVFWIYENSKFENKLKVSLQQKRKRNRTQINIPQRIYHEQLPISDDKYLNLKSLCLKGAIPTHFHNQFLNLPHSPTVMDKLPQPDEEEQ